MREFYIVIDQDDDKELVYKPTQHTYILDNWAELQPFPKWDFEHSDCRITVYGVALYHMPVGEDLEEMEQRILVALDLV
ncbi:MAG: hypothetical protein H0X30_34610 [Anaerolineae bacterium]|nr:hypothetical protein [Anaerolineae bacterium]